MGYTQRQKIIQELQEKRNSKVITYFMSDRRAYPDGWTLPALSTRLGTEAQPFIYDQLRALGKADNLDLYLYTRGGQTDSVWALVNLLREYKNQRLTVLVPFRAHSAGTLICLGADHVLMGEAG